MSEKVRQFSHAAFSKLGMSVCIALFQYSGLHYALLVWLVKFVLHTRCKEYSIVKMCEVGDTNTGCMCVYLQYAAADVVYVLYKQLKLSEFNIIDRFYIATLKCAVKM